MRTMYFEPSLIGCMINNSVLSHTLLNSGAPARAEGACVRSIHSHIIGNPSSRENLDVTYVRTYVRPSVRTHGLGLGTSFSFCLCP